MSRSILLIFNSTSKRVEQVRGINHINGGKLKVNRRFSPCYDDSGTTLGWPSYWDPSPWPAALWCYVWASGLIWRLLLGCQAVLILLSSGDLVFYPSWCWPEGVWKSVLSSSGDKVHIVAVRGRYWLTHNNLSLINHEVTIAVVHLSPLFPENGEDSVPE